MTVGTLVACGDNEPIVIGYIGGLSGHAADLGLSALNGVRLAVERQNRQGGIHGHPVLLVIEDDRQDEETARASFNRLAERHVEAIIGPATTSIAVALTPLANEKHLLLLSPTVTGRQLAQRDDYFIRTIADSRQYAQVSAQFHADKRHIKSFAILYDSANQAYADSWSEDFTNAFTARAGKVVARIAFRSTAIADYSALVQQALNSGAEAILLLGSSVDDALLCQQIRLINEQIPVVASEWGATERLIALGGAAVEGLFTAQFIDRDSDLPAYVAFRRLFVERYQQEPGFPGISGYDTATLLLDSLGQRHSGESIKAAILRIADFPGLQNPIHIDQFGDSTRPTYLTMVRNGKYVRVD